MPTVKEIVPLIKDASEIYLFWRGDFNLLDPNRQIDMTAYGDCAVTAIERGCGNMVYELHIKPDITIAERMEAIKMISDYTQYGYIR